MSWARASRARAARSSAAVTDWHRWLGAERRRAATRRARSPARRTSLFLLHRAERDLPLVCRAASRLQRLRPITAASSRGLAGKARDFNWHNVIGFWSRDSARFVVASGVVMSYPWATTSSTAWPGASRRAAAWRPRGRVRVAPRAEPRPTGAKPEVMLAGLDRAWATAPGQMAGWRTATLRVPPSAEAPCHVQLRHLEPEPDARARERRSSSIAGPARSCAASPTPASREARRSGAGCASSTRARLSAPLARRSLASPAPEP